MSTPITGLPNFPTSKQVPDKSIMDLFGRQAYLGNQFIGNSGSVTLADTSEHPVLYLANPATNGVSIFNSVRKFFAGDTTNSIVFKIYTNPTTVTSGTAITPANCRLASATTSVMTCKKSVSAVSNGTLIATLPIGLGYFPLDSVVLLILDPGQSILITATGSAATSCVVEFGWFEI